MSKRAKLWIQPILPAVLWLWHGQSDSHPGPAVVLPGPIGYHLQMRVQRVNIALSCSQNIE